MALTIALFELRKRLTQLSTYVYLAIFFAAGLISIFAAGGAFSNVSAGAGSEKIHANAPLILQGFIANLSYLGILMSAAVFGQAVHQDYEARTDQWLFSYPIKKGHYLGGRFLGAFLFVALVFLAIGFGVFAGAHFPFFIDKSLFGPTRIAAYLLPYLTSVLPDMFFTGALFFALGALGRRMMPVYLGAVVVVLGYLVSGMLLQDVEQLKLAALLDPFGSAAIRGLTRYWTVAERNDNLIPLRGLFLANRAIWSGLGVALLVLTQARFRLGAGGESSGARKPRDDAKLADAGAPMPSAPAARGDIAALFRLTRLTLAETIKNTYFGVLAGAAVVMALLTMSLAGKLRGTPTWPVTGTIAALGEGAFGLFMLIVITFYSGEILWRERDLGLAPITDALPVRTWVYWLSKLLALCIVPAVLLLAIIPAGVLFQTAQGYHRYELGVYLQRLYLVGLPDYLFLCILAFFAQALLQNKYVGHFVMVGWYLLSAFFDKIGLENPLFHYGETPPVPYSDMNGNGPFLKPAFAFDAYWGGFALALAVVAGLFWARGSEAPFGARAKLARQRLTWHSRLGLALGLLLAAAAGRYIYYNQDILNHFRTSHQREQLAADYERKYQGNEQLPQPRVTGVTVQYDLYPEQLALDARGEYQLENKSGQPISSVFVELPDELPFRELRIGEVSAPSASDRELGVYIYRLDPPMQPGAKSTLRFSIRYQDRGFKARGNRTDIAANGTFFNSMNLPRIGYQRGDELEDDNERKKYGFGPRERLPDLHDAKGLANNLLGNFADWVTFDGTVSTSADQLAVLPGKLVKEWSENGRRYFHYQAESPILDFFALNSARYSVKKDQWNGVALEIDYHAPHTFDLDEMMRGMKDGLGYYSQQFGPFQFSSLRILEFPDYASFAQSYPGVIPYSESIGFILRVDPDKPRDIDFPYYVTAHEVAHQWWAHQLIGGDVQGVTLLDETLAQYSALMVMKQRFGAGSMRRFLKYELDQYLRGRAAEQKRELPLLRVENQQYIHYNKGSLVMYALQDYIGEDKVDAALRALLDQYKFKGPPYPSAQLLYDELAKVTPPELQYLLPDLFEKITLYDNRALSATARKAAQGGGYELQLKLLVKKLQAGDQGAEKEVPADDFIDVGALDADGQPLALTRVRLKSGEQEYSLHVDRLPAKAGIDPLNKLIDRTPDDNAIAVETVSP